MNFTENAEWIRIIRRNNSKIYNLNRDLGRKLKQFKPTMTEFGSLGAQKIWCLQVGDLTLSFDYKDILPNTYSIEVFRGTDFLGSDYTKGSCEGLVEDLLNTYL